MNNNKSKLHEAHYYKQKIKDAIYKRNYVYNFHYHLIWVTKYRHPVFTSAKLRNSMKDILLKLAKHKDIKIETMEIMPDHIHLLISFKPKYAPSNIVKALKGGSAKLFFDEYPKIKQDKFWSGHLWSHSYFMSTLGNMSKATVEKYISNQYTK